MYNISLQLPLDFTTNSVPKLEEWSPTGLTAQDIRRQRNRDCMRRARLKLKNGIESMRKQVEQLEAQVEIQTKARDIEEANTLSKVKDHPLIIPYRELMDMTRTLKLEHNMLRTLLGARERTYQDICRLLATENRRIEAAILEKNGGMEFQEKNSIIGPKLPHTYNNELTTENIYCVNQTMEARQVIAECYRYLLQLGYAPHDTSEGIPHSPVSEGETDIETESEVDADSQNAVELESKLKNKINNVAKVNSSSEVFETSVFGWTASARKVKDQWFFQMKKIYHNVAPKVLNDKTWAMLYYSSKHPKEAMTQWTYYQRINDNMVLDVQYRPVSDDVSGKENNNGEMIEEKSLRFRIFDENNGSCAIGRAGVMSSSCTDLLKWRINRDISCWYHFTPIEDGTGTVTNLAYLLPPTSCGMKIELINRLSQAYQWEVAVIGTKQYKFT